jgi:FixJ family two-component response regulator
VVKAAKRVAPRAPVIITSRLADEFLWTEALSQGAYDLLPKPMHKAEFLRVVLGAVKEIQAA